MSILSNPNPPEYSSMSDQPSSTLSHKEPLSSFDLGNQNISSTSSFATSQSSASAPLAVLTTPTPTSAFNSVSLNNTTNHAVSPSTQVSLISEKVSQSPVSFSNNILISTPEIPSSLLNPPTLSVQTNPSSPSSTKTKRPFAEETPLTNNSGHSITPISNTQPHDSISVDSTDLSPNKKLKLKANPPELNTQLHSISPKAIASSDLTKQNKEIPPVWFKHLDSWLLFFGNVPGCKNTLSPELCSDIEAQRALFCTTIDQIIVYLTAELNIDESSRICLHFPYLNLELTSSDPEASIFTLKKLFAYHSHFLKDSESSSYQLPTDEPSINSFYFIIRSSIQPGLALAIFDSLCADASISYSSDSNQSSDNEHEPSAPTAHNISSLSKVINYINNVPSPRINHFSAHAHSLSSDNLVAEASELQNLNKVVDTKDSVSNTIDRTSKQASDLSPTADSGVVVIDDDLLEFSLTPSLNPKGMDTILEIDSSLLLANSVDATGHSVLHSTENEDLVPENNDTIIPKSASNTEINQNSLTLLVLYSTT
ncbi:hypothetical protein BB560_004961 [Smittium megazygosporum]|uniref:Uncharacterized protein n=1 Tax=Smittium megazygosporum TaxID=133381 RepID=A0A2T9Z7X8_9FUNG|nr:hypothetical protein BB560_004961 [Smittium megazygosporum]